jgi:hypothetical protein
VGTPIEKPKTPGALRVYDLLDIFTRARLDWGTYAFAIGAAYADEWNAQKDCLSGIRADLLLELERANFVMSIVTAGIAGGSVGWAMSGGFIKTAEVENVLGKFGAEVAKGLGSEAAKKTASMAFSKAKVSGERFEPAGTNTTAFSNNMQTNVGVFFMGLERGIAELIRDLESRGAPYAEGDGYYQAFLKLTAISSTPDDRDINDVKIKQFHRDLGLSLWIAWGAARDFSYWNKKWQIVDPVLNPHGTGSYTAGQEIVRWDPILDEIRRLDATLVPFVTSSGMIGFSGWDPHLDIRKLKSMGEHTRIDSLKTLSRYFNSKGRDWGHDDAMSIMLLTDPKNPDKGP